MKATAVAPANIAFIKYWGKKDEALRLPLNSSLSMNLSGAVTTTTVEFSDTYKQDEISLLYKTKRPLNFIQSKKDNDSETLRIIKHLDRIRKYANVYQYAKVVTQNTFPSSSGLASSASGFAALTVAACSALKLHLSEKELTILARLGSGSACRSIPDGFVLWEEGNSSETSFAHSLFPSTHWKLVDIVVIVDDAKKEISTTQGMELVTTSPFWNDRVQKIPEKMKQTKIALREKNIQRLGEIIEEECLDMHHVMQTQQPPVVYWNKETEKVMELTRMWRKEGLNVYFTIDAGPNVHLICEAKDMDAVAIKAQATPGVRSVIKNTVSVGAHLEVSHLF